VHAEHRTTKTMLMHFPSPNRESRLFGSEDINLILCRLKGKQKKFTPPAYAISGS
jgi:hypothetical protein